MPWDSQTTASFYDYTQIASLWSRLSVWELTRENSDLVQNEIYKITWALSANSGRPLIIYAWEETIRASLLFLEKIRHIIDAGLKFGRMGKVVMRDVEKLLQKTEYELKSSPPKCSSIHQVGNVFWIEIPWNDLESIWNEEMDRYSAYWKPWELKGITDMVIDLSELDLLTQVFAKFANNPDIPSTYLESDQNKHYLFWIHDGIQSTCAIPIDYSMWEYLRFNSPHNDLHLAHLRGINDWVLSYTDKMTERAYFEAVAVLSEKEFLEKFEQNNSLVTEIYEAFSTERKQYVWLEKFRLWSIQMRGYELRLRAVRLLADFCILQRHMNFADTVAKISSKFSLSEGDVEGEVRKYIEFPGLGAVYTYGSRVLEKNIRRASEAIITNGKVNRTWSDFVNNQ